MLINKRRVPFFIPETPYKDWSGGWVINNESSTDKVFRYINEEPVKTCDPREFKTRVWISILNIHKKYNSGLLLQAS